MASRKLEDIHRKLLDKLLSDSQLECTRTVSQSLESSSITEETGENGTSEEEADDVKEESLEEEMSPQAVEEIEEQQPEVFPTPSLRKVLPERIRKIEEHNRLHVLPEKFRTDIDPASIPRIAATARQQCVDILGDLTGCTEYRSSLAEFWFLDTLANLLRRAQQDEMCRHTDIRLWTVNDDLGRNPGHVTVPFVIALISHFTASQAVLIAWFCEWIKEMQHFDAADRRRMLKRFEENMLSAARYVGAEQRLPTPNEAGVRYSPVELVQGKSISRTAPESKHQVTFEGAAYECSLRDLTYILHYIFDLFSTDYQFDIVRAVFTSTPEHNLIDIPFQMRQPKRLFAPMKIKPKKEPKRDKPASKGKKKEVDTDEYIALLQLRAKDEREQEELADRDCEEWHRRNHILPLCYAADEEFFNKYWPPPPPPEIERKPELEQGKGKRKVKK